MARVSLAQFVEQDRDRTLLEEHVSLRLVADLRIEVLAHDAVPVWAIVLIKVVFQMFRYLVLNLQVLHGVFGLVTSILPLE